MAGGRQQRVSLGGFNAVKSGVPTRLADPYYWIMEMSWPAFVLLVSLVFAAINLTFGLVYLTLPGSIANTAPGSLGDAVFFSVDTLATVGYGSMYPASHVGHMVASLEMLTGLFFSATVTGLIFARFARPRESLAFSNVAVIGRYEGQRALMVRVASIRSRSLADAVAQLSWLQTTRQPDGRVFQRLTELALVSSRNPIFGLAWTLIHVIEDDSPMLASLEGPDHFLLTASVRGVDTLLASSSQGGRRYIREDVRIDHDFVDIISDVGGTMHLDLALLHETSARAA